MNKRIKITNLRLPIDNSDKGAVKAKISKQLRVGEGAFGAFKLTNKALDARKKNDIAYVFSAELTLELPKEKWGKLLALPNVAVCEKEEYTNPFKVFSAGGEFFLKEESGAVPLHGYDGTKRIIVVGCGPAGLFAALTLAEAGLAPLVIERGKPVDERLADINLFLDKAILDTESNVLFGEGGAGAFSDGKLTTGTKDERIRKVLEELTFAGAGGEILYDAKPHIGTDVLREVLKALRFKIISLGGEFRFSTRLEKLCVEKGTLTGVMIKSKGVRQEIPCDRLITAIGNSASDTLRMLHFYGVEMARKPFSIGVRIEHTREFIDRSQYGAAAGKLPAAEYKLSMRTKSGVGVYTFCMCPGGFVIPSVNEEGLLCVNGMSNHARDAENSNSALLVTIGADISDDVFPRLEYRVEPDPNDVFLGLKYREELERRAYWLGGGSFSAPVTFVGDFMLGRGSTSLGSVTPSIRPGYKLCDISECLGGFVSDSLREALAEFDGKIKGFADESAVLTAVETRSSSPVKILRGGDFQASIAGLFPAGEGGGFAGGIVSSAVDGIKAAEALCRSLKLDS